MRRHATTVRFLFVGKTRYRICMKPLHTNMSDNQLEIFGNLHIINSKVNWMLCNSFAAPTGKAENSEGSHPFVISDLQRAHDIFRIAAAGEHDQDIASIGLDFKLLSKDLIVSDIIGETRQDSRIRTQRFNSQSAAITKSSAVEKIVGQMNRISRAAAVAAQVHGM